VVVYFQDCRFEGLLSENTRGGTRPILLKNSVLANLRKILALKNGPDRFVLGAYKRT
jgi:hypothetical protein